MNMQLARYGLVALGFVIAMASAAGGNATGALAITSEPSVAAVYVDGRFVGQTPIEVPNLATGDHRVRLVKTDYLEHSRVVNVDSGKTGALRVRLTRAVQSGAATLGLKILIIAGEGAVNIIQQKTAVAPVVEVRDRNDQPVAGAVVRFAIQGGRASFNGAQTLSVTTNVAGRAAVTGLTPTSSGAFQISASAAFQGQTAAVNIAQTNVMTAAQAAQIASASGAGGVGSGAAAGVAAAGGAATAGGVAAGGAAAGGGLSAIAIGGIVGGAVAGGAIAAKQVGLLGGGGVAGIYEGPFSLQLVQSTQFIQGNGTISLSCSISVAITGELRLDLQERADGTLAGSLGNKFSGTESGRTCTGTGGIATVTFTDGFGGGDVSGPTANITANIQQTDGVNSSQLLFSGALGNDGKITGTLTMSSSSKSIPNANGFFSQMTQPAVSTSVTLDK